MRTQRSYYEILGLPRTSTQQEIKKRYRELARKFHPDVHPDKTLAQRAFVQIGEAYKTLADPLARRQYDASLGPAAASTQAGPRPTQTRRQRFTEVDRLLAEAQLAFVRGKFNEASLICRKALNLNPRSARAHAVLGDINRVQGHTEKAIVEYGFAIQLDPNDQQSRIKMERLVREESDAMRRQSGPRPTVIASAELLVGNMIGWGIVFFLLLLISIFPGSPLVQFKDYLPSLAKWSANLIFFLAADGALVGLLLSLNGLLGHPDDELMSQPVPLAVRRARSVPVGVAVMLLSVVFFYGAAAFYLLVAVVQEHASSSVMRVLGAVVGIVLLAAVMYAPARPEVLLFGGNVVFPAMVGGWYLGQFMKPGV